MTEYPMPTECRILTALLLSPMTSNVLAACLNLNLRHVRKRLSYLSDQREVMTKIANSGRGGRSQRVFTLTPKGQGWAMEFME